MVYLGLLIFVELILFKISFIGNRRDIMAPSTMMTAVFIFSTFLTMLNLKKWNIEFNAMTCLLISTGLVAFVLGDLSIAKLYRNRKGIFINYVGVISINRWKIVFIILFDILILFLAYREVIRIAHTESSFSNLYYAYRQISHSSSRTAEQYMSGIVVHLMKIVICSAYICGFTFVNNVILCKQKMIANIKYIIPSILMSVMTLITGGRTNILRLFICLLLNTYILLQYREGWSAKISRKFIKILAVSLVSIFVLFSLSQTLLGRSGSNHIIDIISNYAGASIQLFNLYVANPFGINLLWGQETFSAIWALFYKFGVIEVNASGLSEFRNLEAQNIGNVYTFFRCYYQDFGIAGMLVMTFLTAVLFSWIYNCRIKGKCLNYRVIMQIIIYGYLYYIIAVSSIVDIIKNYLSIGTFLLFVVFEAVFYFLFGTQIFKDKHCSKIVLKVLKE